MKILTRLKCGTDIIIRTELINIENVDNLKEEVVKYYSKNKREVVIDCVPYNESFMYNRKTK